MSFAIIAGICASLASVIGKLPSYVDKQVLLPSWLAIAVCILFVIILNGLMWTYFVRALQEKGGSLVATVVSSGTNYCCSAAFGCLLFGETTTFVWWIGTSLILIGLTLVCMENTVKVKTT